MGVLTEGGGAGGGLQGGGAGGGVPHQEVPLLHGDLARVPQEGRGKEERKDHLVLNDQAVLGCLGLLSVCMLVGFP